MLYNCQLSGDSVERDVTSGSSLAFGMERTTSEDNLKDNREELYSDEFMEGLG
jgi:hypothetical protein